MDIKQIIEQARYQDAEYIAPTPIISISGKTVATEGNFITISGLPKSRKTTFAFYMVASALSHRSIFDIEVNISHEDNVLFIDTEQSSHDFSRMAKLVKSFIRSSTLPDRFNAFLFRKYDPDQIFSAFSQLMDDLKPKLIFLDNLTELAINPNDIPEAKRIIQYLKKITAEYNCVIVTLLHLGKNSLNTTGNLGSYADRGAQSVIKVTYDKDTGASTLEPVYMRSDANFDPISIFFNTETKQYEQTTTTKQKTERFSMANFDNGHHSRMTDAIFNGFIVLRYAEIIDRIKQCYGTGITISKTEVLPALLAMGLIKKEKTNYLKN